MHLYKLWVVAAAGLLVEVRRMMYDHTSDSMVQGIEHLEFCLAGSGVNSRSTQIWIAFEDSSEYPIITTLRFVLMHYVMITNCTAPERYAGASWLVYGAYCIFQRKNRSSDGTSFSRV